MSSIDTKLTFVFFYYLPIDLPTYTYLHNN